MSVAITLRSEKGENLTPSEVDANFSAIKAAVETLQALALGYSVGDVKMSMNATVPSGWLLCNGQTVSRVTYSTLYNYAFNNSLIGSGKPFGTGDGTTTFTLPDFREKIARGKGDAEAVGEAIGSKLKAIDHTHTHTLQVPDLSHTHTQIITKLAKGTDGPDQVVTDVASIGTATIPAQAVSGSLATIDQDVNVEQPSLNVLFLIKY